MHTSEASEAVCAPLAAASAARVLTARVQQVLKENSASSPRLVRIEVPVEAADPVAWLRAQEGAGARWYWSGREGEEEAAAVGAADVCEGTSIAALSVRLAVQPDARLRYYGGLRFDVAAPSAKAAPSDVWAAFGAGRFVLPRFELRRAAGVLTLGCNLRLPHDAENVGAVRRGLEQLAPPAPLPGALPAAMRRTDRPGRAGWRADVEAALAAFEDVALEKVVLARETAFEFAGALDPFVLLRKLRAATPGCFHFAVQPAAGAPVFVGASPERLFRQQGRQVWSEAVAGTRPRGDSAGADAALRAELMDSEKDRREHAFVQRYVRDTLSALCTSLTYADDTSALTLAQGRHLYARLCGTLRPKVTPADVLCALHPTPAVGGTPAAAALRFIRAHERFDRGWYAGPVGWLGAGAAELSVGIRSGLVNDRRLTLFSGAGLVRGSEPEAEWDEVEQKISDFAAVLKLDRARAKDGR